MSKFVEEESIKREKAFAHGYFKSEKKDVKTQFLHPFNAFTAVYLSSSDGCQLKV